MRIISAANESLDICQTLLSMFILKYVLKNPYIRTPVAISQSKNEEMLKDRFNKRFTLEKSNNCPRILRNAKINSRIVYFPIVGEIFEKKTVPSIKRQETPNITHGL